MSEIIELIKVLRERTGAGLMDCKHALVATGNDIEQAVTWLREKGIAKQAKKAGRIAAEGLTTVIINGDKAVLAEVNCETDFVARSEPFIELVRNTAEAALANEPKDIEALLAVKVGDSDVAGLFNDAGIKLGEKLSLRRFLIVGKKPNEIFGSYVHMGGTISILAVMQTNDQEFADNVAMCIASDNPSYIDLSEVSPEETAKEKEIQAEAAKEDPSFAKKPENIREKIIEGRVQKHFESQVFAFQEYLLDNTKTMGQVLKEHNAVLKSFYRYQVGEGLEKRKEDFAAEVAAEMK